MVELFAPSVRRLLRSVVLGVVAAAGLLSCGDEQSPVLRLPPEKIPASVGSELSRRHDEDAELNPRLLRRFKPLLAQQTTYPAVLIDLGRQLYYEPLLSRDGRVSCNSCHPLNHYGATPTARAVGIRGRMGLRNAPSTYNATGHFRQFWDGRAADIREQVSGPLLNPLEMGMDEPAIVRALNGIEGYRRAFAAAFPSDPAPISLTHVAEAIGAFEDGLRTPARWDRYLSGDHAALTAKEKAGAKAFANLGCMVCHEGPFLGGSMFQKVGVMLPWPNQRDHGRGDLTHNPADDMVFKVPSLRNVAETAPYFHDGSVQALGAAVQMMARHQLGVSLSEQETQEIVAWMRSLTGVIPAVYVRAPVLPVAVRQ